jgi:hypothetical protein
LKKCVFDALKKCVAKKYLALFHLALDQLFTFNSVIEKLRAPVPLYRPSSTLGSSWSETSGVKRDGSVIIQVQENADAKKDYIAVV